MENIILVEVDILNLVSPQERALNMGLTDENQTPI